MCIHDCNNYTSKIHTYNGLFFHNISEQLLEFQLKF